jgi:hypothetical protein
MTIGGAWTSRRFGQAAICALLAVALLVFGVANGARGHVHDPRTAGLYNTECPLAELAARQGVASLPSVPPSIWIRLVRAELLPVVASNLSAGVVLSAESRAPPLA